MKNKFGKNNYNYKHGLSHSVFNNTYYHIVKRCNCKKSINYNSYGGRGIKCEWESFDEFYNDMYKSYQTHIKQYGKGRKNVSIDRINNNGNYCKSNCRWATAKQQARNTRTNRFITFNNETLCVADWAKKLNLSYATISNRLNRRKWSVERTLTTPKMVNQFK